MKICSPQLGISPKSVLGGEVFDREILLGLAKKGVKIQIILPKNREFDKNIKNWKIHYLPIKHIPAFSFNFLIVPYLFYIWRQQKFQIIRLHSPAFVGFGALFFKICHKDVKIIATFHQFRETKIFGLGKHINKIWDHIIVDSQNVKDKISKVYKIPFAKITVVHNGVPSYINPLKKDASIVKKLKIKNKFILLYMGLFIERKNPLFLLKVLAKLLKTRSDVVLIFWGKGPLQKEIIMKAKNMGIYNQIIIQKPLFGKNKNKIHNIADIFVHPAYDEGLALSPLEAMACAKPIVMSKAFSAEEVIKNGVNGYLCEVNNVIDWTNSLLKLIENKKLRMKMGMNSLSQVKKEFTWNIAVERHLQILKKLSA